MEKVTQDATWTVTATRATVNQSLNGKVKGIGH